MSEYQQCDKNQGQNVRVITGQSQDHVGATAIRGLWARARNFISDRLTFDTWHFDGEFLSGRES